MQSFIYQKPKIGLLGIMAGAYEPIFPGIIKEQEDYAKDVVRDLSDVVEMDFPRAATCRDDIENIVSYFNENKYDGILIVLLTYSPGMHIVPALRENRLPIAVAQIQPDQYVDTKWGEYELTKNQGIHGTQDNCNAILRMGLNCAIIVENRKAPRFKRFIEDWSYAAKTVRMLKTLKVGVVGGRLPGMGDILMDEAAFMRTFGAEIIHDHPGEIVKYMETLNEEQIQARYEQDFQTFDVDRKLTEESHKEAIKMYLAFKKLCEDKGYMAYTAHFDCFSADGRFKQLPLYAASCLMADGYGYSAEGDVCCAVLVAIAHILCQNANFTEMYTVDYGLNAVICCHAGEGNWATSTKRFKPRLIDRYLGEGGLDNPPTPIFLPEPGEATLASLVALEGSNFRLVVTKGTILDKLDMENCEMPYLFFKFDKSVQYCIEQWLILGGTHHEAITIGDTRERWKMICRIIGIEYCEI
jgi:L-arabinose isomerase